MPSLLVRTLVQIPDGKVYTTVASTRILVQMHFLIFLGGIGSNVNAFAVIDYCIRLGVAEIEEN